MRIRLAIREKVSRVYVRYNRNCLFLYGDLTTSIINEPNVICIAAIRESLPPHIYKPRTVNKRYRDLFFIDEEYHTNKVELDRVFRGVRDYAACDTIVICSGSFHGWAKFEKYAPRTLSYIASSIIDLNRERAENAVTACGP